MTEDRGQTKNDSKYFFCEKLGRRTAKVMCVYWQKQAKEARVLKKHQEKCLDCEQGKKIIEELRDSGIANSQIP